METVHAFFPEILKTMEKLVKSLKINKLSIWHFDSQKLKVMKKLVKTIYLITTCIRIQSSHYL